MDKEGEGPGPSKAGEAAAKMTSNSPRAQCQSPRPGSASAAAFAEKTGKHPITKEDSKGERAKIQNSQKTVNKRTRVSPCQSMVNLNVNGLNSQAKRHAEASEEKDKSV